MVKAGSVLMAFSMALLMGLTGCAVQQTSPPPAFQAQPISGGGYEQKADNLVFILDASSSMSEAYNGVEKFALARNVVANFNQTMPDLSVQTVVRTFGHDPRVSPRNTEKIYGLSPYSKSGVAGSLQKVPVAGGPSPLYAALKETIADLKGTTGEIAAVIVSDGKDMGPETLAVANALKSAYADRLCIYTVSVSDEAAGRSMMQQLSSLTGCGKDVPVDELASGAAMADFVQTVLLTEQMDSDGDGVPDSRDACPGTPRGAPVDEKGCPKDSDGDGVYDYMDLCPDTPRGTPVDKNGCPLPRASKSAEVTAAGTWIYRDVQFEINKSELRPSAYRVLDEIVEVMEEQPNLRIEVQGHTDSTGARAYNQKLSERRAQSVVDYLKKEGIAANRMSAKGYGMDQPMDTNATTEGRARNRRVEIKPLQ